MSLLAALPQGGDFTIHTLQYTTSRPTWHSPVHVLASQPHIDILLRFLENYSKPEEEFVMAAGGATGAPDSGLPMHSAERFKVINQSGF